MIPDAGLSNYTELMRLAAKSTRLSIKRRYTMYVKMSWIYNMNMIYLPTEYTLYNTYGILSSSHT